MKRILITLLALCTLAISATAQEKRMTKNRHHQKHQKGMMAKQLNFSEGQKMQAKVINADFRKKMQELNKNESITVKEMRDRKQAILKEKKAKMDGLLTADQKTKLTQLKADQKVKSEERYAKHLAKMKTNLGLTDAQVVKMKAQRESIQLKMKTIKGNESLSREQKKEQMMSLKSEAKEQRKKIFTAEQLKKMEEMKKNRVDKNRAK